MRPRGLAPSFEAASTFDDLAARRVIKEIPGCSTRDREGRHVGRPSAPADREGAPALNAPLHWSRASECGRLLNRVWLLPAATSAACPSCGTEQRPSPDGPGSPESRWPESVLSADTACRGRGGSALRADAPELPGERQGLLVGVSGRRDLGRGVLGGDLANEAKRPGLVTALIAFAGEVERSLRELRRLLEATGREISLAQQRKLEGMEEHRQPLPRPGVHVQARAHP